MACYKVHVLHIMMHDDHKHNEDEELDESKGPSDESIDEMMDTEEDDDDDDFAASDDDEGDKWE